MVRAHLLAQGVNDACFRCPSLIQRHRKNNTPVPGRFYIGRNGSETLECMINGTLEPYCEWGGHRWTRDSWLWANKIPEHRERMGDQYVASAYGSPTPRCCICSRHLNTHTHARTHTHTHAHTHTRARTRAQTHTRTHARANTHTHTHTHTHTPTHTHAHAHAHAHTHTHTHTNIRKIL